MVRKVQKRAVKPSTEVTKTSSKTKLAEECRNGCSDNESENALNTEVEMQENVDNRIIERVEDEKEAISSENSKSVPKSRKRKSPVALNTKEEMQGNGDNRIIEQVEDEKEAILSQNPKSMPKSRKRKSPVVLNTEEEIQDNVDNRIIEQVEDEKEAILSENPKNVPKGRKKKSPVALNTEEEMQENVDNQVEDKKESILSKNPKSVPKSKKRVAPKEVKEGKKVVAETKVKRQRVLLEIPDINSVSGKVFVIGMNDVGQLGLGEDIIEKKRPALLQMPHSIVDIAAGGMHSVCLTESGEVITFGCNDEGALGRLTPDEESERVPRRVNITERIVQVSAGDSHTAALSDSGQVYIWGNFRNGSGTMGLVRYGQKECLPVKILNNVIIVKIASGADHLVCLSQEGCVYTCGCGETGQLGRVSVHSRIDGGRKGPIYLLTPGRVPVSRFSDIVNNIWTGSYSTFIRVRNQESGLIYAFGLNNYNQLGFRNAGEQDEQIICLKPKRIDSFNNKMWQEISGGQHHTVALDVNGLVHSLGRAEYGMLGLGENTDVTSEPTPIPTLQDTKCVDISCGNLVSFAVVDNGTAYSWGMGTNYQLGHGNDNDQYTPRQIEGNFVTSWKAMKTSGGGQHTLILATPREDSKASK